MGSINLQNSVSKVSERRVAADFSGRRPQKKDPFTYQSQCVLLTQGRARECGKRERKKSSFPCVASPSAEKNLRH